MTPCIKLLKKKKIPYTLHKYNHNTGTQNYGEEVVGKLGLDAKSVFKTLVVLADDTLVVAIVPVSSMLNMKLCAKAMGAKKAKMAEASVVEKSTGYILGGVSPIGQKKRLTTLIDSSANLLDTLYVSAGKRGLEVALKPNDLLMITEGKFVNLC